MVIILSGNFSFLNWLTMLPAIFCFDDEHLSSLFSFKTLKCVPVVEKLSAKFHHRPGNIIVISANGAVHTLIFGICAHPSLNPSKCGRNQ